MRPSLAPILSAILRARAVPVQAQPSSPRPDERAAPEQSGERANASQPAPIPVPQPPGSFPTNDRSALPLWRPEGGAEGYRTTIAAGPTTLR